jgi:hypothetical protein
MMKCAAQLYLTIVSIVGLGIFFILHPCCGFLAD